MVRSVTRGTRDDPQQHQTLHRQVVEAVPAGSAPARRRDRRAPRPGRRARAAARCPGRAGRAPPAAVRSGNSPAFRDRRGRGDRLAHRWGAELLGHRRAAPADPRVSWLRPGPPRVAQVSPRGAAGPRPRCGPVPRSGPATDRSRWLGAHAGQRPAQRPVVPGEDQRDGEPVQQVGQQRRCRRLAAACSRARTGRSWSAHQRAAAACSSATRCGPWRCRSASR